MKNVLTKLGFLTLLLSFNVSILASGGQMGTVCGKFDAEKETVDAVVLEADQKVIPAIIDSNEE